MRRVEFQSVGRGFGPLVCLAWASLASGQACEVNGGVPHDIALIAPRTIGFNEPVWFPHATELTPPIGQASPVPVLGKGRQWGLPGDFVLAGEPWAAFGDGFDEIVVVRAATVDSACATPIGWFEWYVLRNDGDGTFALCGDLNDDGIADGVGESGGPPETPCSQCVGCGASNFGCPNGRMGFGAGVIVPGDVQAQVFSDVPFVLPDAALDGGGLGGAAGYYDPDSGNLFIDTSGDMLILGAEYTSPFAWNPVGVTVDASDRIFFADFTGNGRTDLHLWDSQSTDWYIFAALGPVGNGFSSTATHVQGMPAGGRGFLADLNRDGRVDVCRFNPSTRLVQYRAKGIGASFGSLQTYADFTTPIQEKNGESLLDQPAGTAWIDAIGLRFDVADTDGDGVSDCAEPGCPLIANPGGEACVDCDGNDVSDALDVLDPKVDCDGTGTPDSCESSANERRWDAGGGGAFSNASNWCPEDVPSAGEVVILEDAIVGTITATAPIVAERFVQRDGFVTLQLDGDLTATASGDEAIVVRSEFGQSTLLVEGGMFLAPNGGMRVDSVLQPSPGLTFSGPDSGFIVQDDVTVVGGLNLAAGAQGVAHTVELLPGGTSLAVDGTLSVQHLIFPGTSLVRPQNGGVITVANPITLAPGGKLLGDGTFDAAILNNGEINPGVDGGGFDRSFVPSTLTLGSLLQNPAPPDEEPSGLIKIRVGGDALTAQSDRVVVSGDATVSGGLIVEFDPSLTAPPESLQGLDVFEVNGTLTGGFDVAVFPGLPNGRFLTYELVTGASRSGRATTSVRLLVNTLSEFGFEVPQPGSFPAGVPAGATVADINLDGAEDVLIALPDPVNPTTGEGALVILYNDDDGNPLNGWEGFGSTVVLPFGQGGRPSGVNPSGVAVAIVDDDLQPDIVVSVRGTPGDPGADSVAVLLVSNPDPFGFVLSDSVSIPVGDEPVDLVAVDLDGDQAADIATANLGSQSVTVLWNAKLGAGPLWTQIDEVEEVDLPPEEEDPSSIEPGDWNAGPFLVMANSGSGSVGVIDVGPGRALSFADGYPVGAGARQVIVADLNSDGDDDIVSLNASGGSISALVNSGGATLSFEAAVTFPVGNGPTDPRQPVAGTALDFDNDGDPDIACVLEDAMLGESVVRIIRNDVLDGRLSLSAAEEIEPGNDPLILLSGDLNSDGLDDLVTLDESTGARGGAVDELEVLLATPLPPPVCVGDLDGDDDTDVFDFNLFAANFGATGLPPFNDGDLDGDGDVDVFDFNVFATDFGCVFEGAASVIPRRGWRRKRLER